MTLEVFTDGSCYNATGEGGYGIVFEDGCDRWFYYAGRYQGVTNSAMEILGVVRSLELIKPNKYTSILIYCDNQYVVNTYALGWLNNWLATTEFYSRKNSDLWIRFIRALNPHRQVGTKIELRWIKGHQTLKKIEDPTQLRLASMNHLADKLAEFGRMSLPL